MEELEQETQVVVEEQPAQVEQDQRGQAGYVTYQRYMDI